MDFLALRIVGFWPDNESPLYLPLWIATTGFLAHFGISAAGPMIGSMLGDVTDEDELYVEPIPTAELNRSPNKYRTLDADEIILQVANSSAGKDVVYLLMSGACKLLHIPQHVFAVLRAHQQHHHVDRHFATHVASFRRRYGEHFLINAHPIFANGAYAAGCINEPNEGNTASMEMQSAKLTVKQRDQDDPFAYKAWRKFAEEFEEVLESVIYFVTTNESYEDREVS